MIRAGGISLFRQEESRKLSVECRRDCTLSSNLLNHTPRDDSEAEKLVKSTGFYLNGAAISDLTALLSHHLLSPTETEHCHCERTSVVGINKVEDRA